MTRRRDIPDPVPIRLLAPRYVPMSADEEATAVAALVAVLVHADEMAEQSRPSDGDATAA